MLVLTRKTQQQIQIGDDITITIIQVKGQAVRVGIEAPRETRVLRAELPKKEVAEVSAKRTNNANSSTVISARVPSDRMTVKPKQAVQSPLTQILARRASSVDPASMNRNPHRSGPAPLVNALSSAAT